MRRQHLDNTTFFVFPKHVILKREKQYLESCKHGIHHLWEPPLLVLLALCLYTHVYLRIYLHNVYVLNLLGTHIVNCWITYCIRPHVKTHYGGN